MSALPQAVEAAPAPATTLEQQLDALITEHRLSSIGLVRIARSDGSGTFWSVNAQGDGKCAGSDYDTKGAQASLAEAIERLNAMRVAPVVVPELECAA